MLVFIYPYMCNVICTCIFISRIRYACGKTPISGLARELETGNKRGLEQTDKCTLCVEDSVTRILNIKYPPVPTRNII